MGVKQAPLWKDGLLYSIAAFAFTPSAVVNKEQPLQDGGFTAGQKVTIQFGSQEFSNWTLTTLCDIHDLS